MRTLSAASPATSPSATTSAWSYISWAFFALAALAAAGIGGWWVALRPAANDPQVGAAAGLFTLLGAGAGWCVALACAAVGSVCGLIGVASPAGRTNAAWGAVALNATVLAVSLVLLLALSP